MTKRSSPKTPQLGHEPHGGEEQYEVGYGKPPQQTRFRRGESGNPNGRPKGVNNLATDVKNALAHKIPVRSEGKSRLVSTQQAGIMLLREKALKGDARALNRLLDLAARFNNEPVQDTGTELTADEQEVLRSYEEEIRASVVMPTKKDR